MVKVDDIQIHYDKAIDVLSLFEEKLSSFGINMMVLKGLGLASLYPHPRNRSFSDIDVYYYDDYDKVKTLLLDKFKIKLKDRVYDHHSSFIYDGIMLENHYDFIDTHAYASHKKFEELLKKLAKEEKETKLNFKDSKGRDFLVNAPGAMLNLLFNLNHLGSHFAGEVISIRHLLDWYFIWKTSIDKVDVNEFYSILSKFHKLKFCNVLNGALIRVFDLDKAMFYGYEENEKLELKMIANIVNPRLNSKNKENFFVTVDRFFTNMWKYKLFYSNETIFGILFKKSYIYINNTFRRTSKKH